MLLCDLPPLHDVLDEIEVIDDDSDEDENLLYEMLLELIDAYIEENPTEITEPDFEDGLFDDLLDLLEIMNMDTIMVDGLEELIEYAIEQYFDTISPPRSHPDTPIVNYNVDVVSVQRQIDYLRSKPQPAQRTPEWYAFRRNLITASNAYKAFESQASKNQLIYEKCKEKVKEKEEKEEDDIVEKQVNTSSSLHWGQKYESVSVALYEYIYNTKVGDFGCIQHDTHSYIGASPDGINILPSSPRFGRMLEIKNVVSREIDGIPKKEYWIQMQLQMETCNLYECDFLETQFKEYETHSEFLLDENVEYRGIILQYATEYGGLKYIYSPVGLTLLELDKWETDTVAMDNGAMDKGAMDTGLEWIYTHYWKIEKISCVLVERNRRWFQSNVAGLTALWDTVLEERVSGFEHRAPHTNANNKTKIKDNAECLFIPNEDGKIM